MSTSAAKKAVFDAIRDAIPDQGMTVSQWAEAHRVVERGARKGRWSNDTVPFATEIMDAASDPNVREIVYQKPSQVAGSEIAVNIIGYFVHLDPTEIAYVAEKEDKAKAWTVESWDTTVRSTDCLRRLARLADADNNQKVKRYTSGANLFILWATSPAELSSRPIRVLIFDEKAAFKATSEGSAVKLGEARTKTYDGEEKIIKISSPRNRDDDTDISWDFERGDRREYYVPCPHCDELQTLKFGGKDLSYGLKWDDDEPEHPWYLCEHCGAMIEEFDKEEMLARGKWIAGADFNGVASFKINQIYSPFVRWGRMVVDFLEAKRFRSTLQVWMNTALGEPWQPEEQIEWGEVRIRREQYPAPWPEMVDGRQLLVVPDGVLMLTAGVDVQGDRLECEVVGWGRDHESWSIDYRIFEGDPGQNELWEELSDYLAGEFPSFEAGKVLRVAAVGVDTGFHTETVYRVCKAHNARRWYPVKGSATPSTPALTKPKVMGKNVKVRLHIIGTNTIKDEVFSFLRVGEPGPGFCHFPDDQRYDDAYLKQLCSEKRVQHHRMGQPYSIYEKVSASARNEALDVRVYATAARMILNPNYEAIERRTLKHAEAADRPVDMSMESTHPENVLTKRQNVDTSKVVPFRTVLNKHNEFAGYKP